MRRLYPLAASMLACLLISLDGLAAEGYSFGVLSQRSPVLTARYWNPILDYVARKTGIQLSLRLARSGTESKVATAKGEYDFVYSNHIFQPGMATASYRVILRPRQEAIAGQIVTLEGSPIKALKDLDGREVGFPSQVAFVGYAVPMDALLRQHIAVKPVFGGNQEGIMGQLKAGRVIAACVNNQLMKAFAGRENIRYRVLWESAKFHDLPIAVHARVPKTVADAVRAAIDGMEDDEEGRRILRASAQAVGQAQADGFQASSPADYQNYVDFYRTSLVKDVK